MSQPHRSPALRAPPESNPSDPSVVLYCPRRLVGDVLKAWLNRAGFRVVGRVDEIAALGRVCGVHHPDLVIVDAGTDLSPIRDFLADPRSSGPRTHLVVIYDRLSAGDLAAAQRSGLGGDSQRFVLSAVGNDGVLIRRLIEDAGGRWYAILPDQPDLIDLA